MEEQTKMKKSTKYLLIGTLVLFLSILGASMAYYLARVSGNLSGRAAGTELAINVQKISSNANMDLIPLDNDLETLNLAAAGYDNKGACVDINGYSVCQIYKITVTNNGSIDLKMNGTVTLSGQNTPNIDCATMTNETTVANNNSCMNGMFVSGDELPANDHNDYYVMVYINNLDESQYDSGEFNGTVTFTTEDGRKVKGRFTKPFNLVQRITKLYNDDTKTEVENNSIKYNYATNVGLMNDRLGGTTESLDGGNTRYYGAEPNNWIDIGDKTEVEVTQGNWVSILGTSVTTIDQCKSSIGITDESTEEQIAEVNSQIAAVTDYSTVNEFCSVSTIPAGTPILWRIIGVFDGKLRVIRDEAIGKYSWDTSASDINNGNGINEWSQADLMKLLNPGYEANQDFDTDGESKILANNSLYWNSGSGKCYNGSSYSNTMCDFTNIGLSDEAKEYVVDQTLYFGSVNEYYNYANQAYIKERETNVIQNSIDGIARSTRWIGKVGLIYPSDFGYSSDFNNCITTLSTIDNCSISGWLLLGIQSSISPLENTASENYVTVLSTGVGAMNPSNSFSIYPTLLLDSSALAESGNGSKEHPYVLTP